LTKTALGWENRMKLVKISETFEVFSPVMGKQQRRIAILQRDDGHFSFAEQYFFTSEYEGEIIAEGWHHRRTEGIFASAELAEAAGRAALPERHRTAFNEVRK
jgi:hypothetical protein